MLLAAAVVYGQECNSGVTFKGAKALPLTTSSGRVTALLRQPDGSYSGLVYSHAAPIRRVETVANFQQNLLPCGFTPPPSGSPAPAVSGLVRTSAQALAADMDGNGSLDSVSLPLGRLTILGSNSIHIGLTEANYDVKSVKSTAVPSGMGTLQSLAVADFNRDGKPDVLARLFAVSGNTLRLFLGNGDGTLQTPGTLPLSGDIRGMAVLDINTDSIPDVIVNVSLAGGATSASVAVLVGNGNGTFQAPVHYALPGLSFPEPIAAADFNNDGRPDIVTADQSDAMLAILPGAPGGAFGAAIVSTVASGASALDIGDFNKDGKADVALADRIKNTLHVALGNGLGGVIPAGAYLGAYSPETVTVADVNNDGHLDVIHGMGNGQYLLPDRNSESMLVLFGYGDGTFYGTPSIPFQGGPHTMKMADLNNDGRSDLILSVSFRNTSPQVYLGNVNGSLTPGPVPITLPFSAYGPIAIADLTGDGLLDAVISSGSVYILPGNGNGGFGAPLPAITGAGTNAVAVEIADLNKDGRNDLLVLNWQNGNPDSQLTILYGTPGGGWSAPAQLSAGRDPRAIHVADLNADGRPDIMVVTYGEFFAISGSDLGALRVHLQTPGGTFPAATLYPAGTNPTSASFADFNADTALDAVVSAGGSSGNDLRILLGNSNGTFGAATPLASDFGPGQSSIADINNDGKLDIVMPHCCGSTSLGYYLGNGNGTFQSEVLLPGITSPQLSLARDLNGDGRADLILAHNTASVGNLSVLLQLLVCTYSVTPAGGAIPQAGGGLAVTVTTQPGCAWSSSIVSSTFPSLSVLPGSGSGTAVVNLGAPANNSGTAFSAVVRVHETHVTVTQNGVLSPGCTATLAASSFAAPQTGAKSTVNLSLGGACNWTATSNQPWAQVFPISGTGPRAVEYTVFPNFSTKARTAVLSIGGLPFTITQPGSSEIEVRRFVRQMYFNFFGRLPSEAEVDFNVNALNTAVVTRVQLVSNFFNSAEFNNAGRFIAGLYVGILNRNAEYGGWLFIRNALSTGAVQYTDLVHNFIESAEFKLNHPSLTNRQFAALMYQQILLRAGTSAELDFMESALAGGLSRAQFATNFLQSAEFRAGTGPRLTTFVLYACLLQRDPSNTEYTNVIASLLPPSSTPVATVIDTILKSPEFAALFL